MSQVAASLHAMPALSSLERSQVHGRKRAKDRKWGVSSYEQVCENRGGVVPQICSGIRITHSNEQSGQPLVLLHKARVGHGERTEC